ncbi:class I SAM-dependent methyltransferase [Pusillimonas sp. NJUB218]|uniref:class I SAM-dependent methyltransferase n=1 Tax=Pusillimonas sp. NJUB218 TaxID=2023230 RepID=UPI000F4B760F|nr:class I SAM-dependent methyltransferase [Pusillimonas sp. NJUB218]ROT44020.1 hypothetical protein CHR62_14460 [Pusillimonas sp. NJUB218]
MPFDQEKLRDTYRRLAETSAKLSEMSEYFIEMTKLFEEQELWRDYVDVMRLAPSVAGSVVVDIGCKFGHALPLFHSMGATSCIGVDVDDGYLSAGNAAFAAIEFPAGLVKSDDGYLPIESESVDFVLVNEVISHVNPIYLDTLYSEISRVLKVGGHILIADGNNRANTSCVTDLRKLFVSWERGPKGVNTGRDVVSEPFRDRRRDIIAKLCPQLSVTDLEYLADNTSGLFGDRLAIEVGKYLRKDGWVARPYRPGLCPTNPGPGGVVMERAFHPMQVELALAEFGIDARQVHPRAKISKKSFRGYLGPLLYNLKLAVRERFAPRTLRGRTWAFYILGKKVNTLPFEWCR